MVRAGDYLARNLNLGDGRQWSSFAVFVAGRDQDPRALVNRVRSIQDNPSIGYAVSDNPPGVWLHAPAWVLESFVRGKR